MDVYVNRNRMYDCTVMWRLSWVDERFLPSFRSVRCPPCSRSRVMRACLPAINKGGFSCYAIDVADAIEISPLPMLDVFPPVNPVSPLALQLFRASQNQLACFPTLVFLGSLVVPNKSTNEYTISKQYKCAEIHMLLNQNGWIHGIQMNVRTACSLLFDVFVFVRAADKTRHTEWWGTTQSGKVWHVLRIKWPRKHNTLRKTKGRRKNEKLLAKEECLHAGKSCKAKWLQERLNEFP